MSVITPLHLREHLYVDGAWAPPSPTRSSTSSTRPRRRWPGASRWDPGDVDRAVAAARAAFPAWSQAPLEVRQEALTRIADGLEARADELTALIATELGNASPPDAADPGRPAAGDVHRTAPAIVEEVPWRTELGNSLVLREPVGVVGCITPWNYPLHQIAAKVAAALAVGCAVVVKPSEVTPLNAFVLAEVVEAAGLPPGVFNLVTGTGPVVGEALAAHPDGRPRLVHRLDPGRPARERARGGDGQARRARARREVGQRPARRRRPRRAPSPTASRSASSTAGRPAAR